MLRKAIPRLFSLMVSNDARLDRTDPSGALSLRTPCSDDRSIV